VRARHGSLLAVSLGILLVVATPSHAAVGSADPSLLSRFFPTTGRVTAATDEYGSYIFQWTYWHTGARAAALRNNDGDAYEHAAEIHAGAGFCWRNADYDRRQWDSDYPFAYLDTNFMDSGFPNYAGGSARSRLLETGRLYFHWLRVSGRCEDGVPLHVEAQDSHRSGSCSPGYQWCVYPDKGSPRDIVPVTDGFETGQTRDWRYQQLYNDGFEDGSAGWHLRGNTTGITPKWAVRTSSGAVDRAKYLSFRCNGGVGCYIYQVTPNRPYGVMPDDIWTGEFAARCRPRDSSTQSCAVSIGLTALGGGNAAEHVSRGFAVPNDGKWHIYGWRGSQYAAHAQMRFLLSNDSIDDTVDVDLTTLHHSDRY